MPRAASSLAVVLGVLGITAAAFAVTEHLKLEKVPVEATHVGTAISPVCRCASARSVIRLRIRRPDTLTLRIVDQSGTTVRELAHDLHVRVGQIAFVWNGRDANGDRVHDGTYRVRFQLGREGRIIQIPRAIVVDTVSPVARLVSYRPAVLKAGARPRVVIDYRVSEPAHVVLFVDGVRRALSFRTARTGQLQWFAAVARARLPPGRYRLQLAGLDAAGNLGRRTPAFVVRVR